MQRIVAIALLLLPWTVEALEVGPSSRFQQETENWLQVQREGQQQTPTPQVATPAERELGLQRWLDSYKDSIPDFYQQDEGGSLKK